MNKIVALILMLSCVAVANCKPDQTSSDIQRERQEHVLTEGVSQVGIPSIKNWRELKLAKDLYELRDQEGLVTYSYLWAESSGKLIFLCNSIGYPLPYAVQYTAGESMQSYRVTRKNVEDASGVAELPQAEPNGLFSPGSAEGTWVMCLDPNSKNVHPTYVEPKVIASQFKLDLPTEKP
jgi:hypothetical protein